MTRRGSAGAVCLVSLLTVAGCGGTSHSNQSATGPSPHAAFVASVDAVCQRAVEAHAGHPFPLSSFDPLHPDPSQLPVVGNYFARYGQLPVTARALHALTPPAADAGAWSSILGLVDRLTANVRAQIAAARGEKVPVFVSTVLTTKRVTKRIDAAGRRFGFGPESPCARVFG
jgi:hypothetical protein